MQFLLSHMKLIRINDLSAQDIRSIWSLATKPSIPPKGNVAWSFEGNGIRTRTTFIQAFREFNLSFVELPNLLKTNERVADLAGYLDPFYDIYVIRDSNHDRLTEFANASRRPVVNAMTSLGHPCEVLTDAYSIEKTIGPLSSAKVTLWGPTTNIFRSWHELARVLGFELVHLCDAQFHESIPNVRFSESIDKQTDVVITDSWPDGFDQASWSLSSHHLEAMGNPKLLPTPPFSIGREIGFDPVHYKGFMGYEQKIDLLTVQKAILSYLMAQ
jgi:ornithine carbamoyltransferase